VIKIKDKASLIRAKPRQIVSVRGKAYKTFLELYNNDYFHFFTIVYHPRLELRQIKNAARVIQIVYQFCEPLEGYWRPKHD
jgi:hypothetical protein